MYDDEPFRVRRKHFYPLHMARKVVQDLIPSLSHEADGLILQVWEGMRVWNGGVEHKVSLNRKIPE